MHDNPSWTVGLPPLLCHKHDWKTASAELVLKLNCSNSFGYRYRRLELGQVPVEMPAPVLGHDLRIVLTPRPLKATIFAPILNVEAVPSIVPPGLATVSVCNLDVGLTRPRQGRSLSRLFPERYPNGRTMALRGR